MLSDSDPFVNALMVAVFFGVLYVPEEDTFLLKRIYYAGIFQRCEIYFRNEDYIGCKKLSPIPIGP